MAHGEACRGGSEVGPAPPRAWGWGGGGGGVGKYFLAQLSPQMTAAQASVLNEFIRSSKPGPSGKDDVEFLTHRNCKALNVCFKLPICRII